MFSLLFFLILLVIGGAGVLESGTIMMMMMTEKMNFGWIEKIIGETNETRTKLCTNHQVATMTRQIFVSFVTMLLLFIVAVAEFLEFFLFWVPTDDCFVVYSVYLQGGS
jgi:hypothetical protein